MSKSCKRSLKHQVPYHLLFDDKSKSPSTDIIRVNAFHEETDRNIRGQRVRWGTPHRLVEKLRCGRTVHVSTGHLQGRVASIIKLVCSNIVYNVPAAVKYFSPSLYLRRVLQPALDSWTAMKARAYISPRRIIPH